MATYFDTVKKVGLCLPLAQISSALTLFPSHQSYADVPVTDKGVDTSAFLEATDGLIKLFDLLGNSAFAIVQNDMKGNVKVGMASIASYALFIDPLSAPENTRPFSHQPHTE
jgi:hypothetical protein